MLCRAIDGNRLDTNVSNAVKAVLDRAEANAGRGAGKVTKTQRRAQLDAWELHWSALVAARNALQGRRLCLLVAVPPLQNFVVTRDCPSECSTIAA